MKLSVRVKPASKKSFIEKISDKEYILKITAPPVDGKANEAVIKTLSEYFNIPKSRISIIKGLNSKNKIINIA